MHEIKVPALVIKQGRTREIYSFAVNAKNIEDFAAISRAGRDESQLTGYQRPEVINHINDIKRYLESDNPMVPNALVIAFDTRVKFTSSIEDDCFGFLTIPIVDKDKPGWIVDGQQRAAAMREANLGDFQMPISAFITNNAQEQREQFILVNSTKPLPKSLIYELLPYTETRLTNALQKKRFPARLLDELNYRDDSKLNGMIKTATNPDGIIKDNSILKFIENSVTEGALYRFRDPETGEGDVENMLELMGNFWRAVADVFPLSWGLDPRKSRLMHGAGITAMGHVMDAISDRYHSERQVDVTSYDDFRNDLELLSPFCKWSNGYWDFGSERKVKWNELQNISKDINLLTHFLLYKYRVEVWR